MIWDTLILAVLFSCGFIAGSAWRRLPPDEEEQQREIEKLRTSLSISRRIISDQKALIARQQ